MQLSWMLRSQMEALLFFSTISKYTPAKPEVTQPHNTYTRPITLLALPPSPSEVCCESCTAATPSVSARMAPHCMSVICRESMYTENTAVVMIFIWYMTWNTGALSSAMAAYCREFCTVYSTLGTFFWGGAEVRAGGKGRG